TKVWIIQVLTARIIGRIGKRPPYLFGRYEFYVLTPGSSLDLSAEFHASPAQACDCFSELSDLYGWPDPLPMTPFSPPRRDPGRAKQLQHEATNLAFVMLLPRSSQSGPFAPLGVKRCFLDPQGLC